ncbi:MAG: hypothetical protein ACPGYL_08405, partial [Rhodospirillaceae bacterium]
MRTPGFLLLIACLLGHPLFAGPVWAQSANASDQCRQAYSDRLSRLEAFLDKASQERDRAEQHRSQKSTALQKARADQRSIHAHIQGLRTAIKLSVGNLESNIRDNINKALENSQSYQIAEEFKLASGRNIQLPDRDSGLEGISDYATFKKDIRKAEADLAQAEN